MSFSSQDVYKKALGRGGKKRVAEFLRARGLKILKTNYVTPFGEADIIAEDKALGEIAFIEVKTRSSDSYGTPAEAVGTKKREKYRKIAAYYWMETGKEPNARFDVAEVLPGGGIEYLTYAF